MSKSKRRNTPRTDKALTRMLRARCDGMKRAFAKIKHPIHFDGELLQPLEIVAIGESVLQAFNELDKAQQVLDIKRAAARKVFKTGQRFLISSSRLMTQMAGPYDPELPGMGIPSPRTRAKQKPNAARATISQQIRQTKEETRAKNRAVMKATGRARVDMDSGAVELLSDDSEQ